MQKKMVKIEEKPNKYRMSAINVNRLSCRELNVHVSNGKSEITLKYPSIYLFNG